MTRINIIPVEDLTDQHLMAEYREIFMIGSALQRSLKSEQWDPKRIPKKFTLNSGHVYFFYNKGKYLHERYLHIIDEMKQRGFNPDNTRIFPTEVFKDNGLYNDWLPTIEDQKIIRERISLRISQKPDWYRRTEYV